VKVTGAAPLYGAAFVLTGGLGLKSLNKRILVSKKVLILSFIAP
jgi:hypothetical protein